MTVISHPEFTARTALADATQCCHHDARTMPAGGSMSCILRLLSLPLMLLVHASALAATVPEIPMLRRYTVAAGLPATFVRSLEQDREIGRAHVCTHVTN